ncbi:MAG: NAD(P)H-dependent glycerol-3-phosphate dehydrogenase [Legionella sp.]
MNNHTIAILGAGSWGTAVAIHLARIGNRVLLWGHRQAHIDELSKLACNERYLPNIPFPPSLFLSNDLDYCLAESTIIICAVPSHAFADLLHKLDKPTAGLAWLTKGIDPNQHVLLSTLVADKWGNDYPIAVISGPSFARELALGMPTALTVAGNDRAYVKTIQKILHSNTLRVYHTDDAIGVQLCGAVKNVLAIACGVSDGLNYGANAKAALITRGLAEMSRLGTSFGARQETFMGLAGIGDLVLTCTDNQSRNRRFGIKLGQGLDPIDAEQQISQVVEGKYNAQQVCTLAAQQQIEMPICSIITELLQNKMTASQAAEQLMKRPARKE